MGHKKVAKGHMAVTKRKKKKGKGKVRSRRYVNIWGDRDVYKEGDVLYRIPPF